MQCCCHGLTVNCVANSVDAYTQLLLPSNGPKVNPSCHPRSKYKLLPYWRADLIEFIIVPESATEPRCSVPRYPIFACQATLLRTNSSRSFTTTPPVPPVLHRSHTWPALDRDSTARSPSTCIGSFRLLSSAPFNVIEVSEIIVASQTRRQKQQDSSTYSS